MGKGKKVRVTQETESGRNQHFVDTSTGRRMSREEFVRQIDKGNYPAYHTRKINGVRTPASNPDKSESNNLD